MKWASALSTRPSLEAALGEVIDQAQTALGERADLALLFIGNSYTSEYPRVLPLLYERLAVSHVVGCGGQGIIGQNSPGMTSEIEDKPAISLTLMHLPGVQLQTFHVQPDHLPDPDSPPDRWVELTQVNPAEQPHFILLADAMSTRINDLIQGLDYAYPGAVKIGGLTSGPQGLGGSGLFCDQQLHREGAVGIALSGDIQIETIVAQGCRPIGPPLRVIEAERNVVLQVEEEMGGDSSLREGDPQTPLEALQTLMDDLDPKDRALAQDSLSIGIISNEFKQTIEPGDFLIRNLIGVDPRIGAIAIADRIRAGQRIQFHLRDAAASAADLELLLRQYLKTADLKGGTPAGALLFACLGRGERFYEQPNFDSNLFHRYVAQIPMGGFFCNGEIGPIGGTTFLHGYTAAFGIFRSQHH